MYPCIVVKWPMASQVALHEPAAGTAPEQARARCFAVWNLRDSRLPTLNMASLKLLECIM